MSASLEKLTVSHSLTKLPLRASVITLVLSFIRSRRWNHSRRISWATKKKSHQLMDTSVESSSKKPMKRWTQTVMEASKY